MITSLTWMPRGVATAKLPETVINEKDDHSSVASDQDMPQATFPPSARKSSHPHRDDDDDDDDLEGFHTASDEDAIGDDGDIDDDDATAASAQPQNAEVDIAEVLANDLEALAFHKRGEKDPYLAADPLADALFDDEDLEALNIKPTDSVIITTKAASEDASTLDVHLFDDDPDASDDDDDDDAPDADNQKQQKTKPVYVPHHYIHHDLVLPALPLCAAYTRIPLADSVLNLVAVGMFTPGIDLWDVDRVNHLEPVVTLGGYVDPSAASQQQQQRSSSSRRKKRGKPKLRLRDGSHSDAVMALSWNSVQHEYLASGSADTTVKIWDVESAHCATTLNHHSSKVQAVMFHPSEAHLLATGGFDRTVHVIDVRAPTDSDAARSWTVGGEVETAQWTADGRCIFATADDGRVSVFDTRKQGRNSKLVDWTAHSGPASACALSTDVPGLMVTGGVDKHIKVWDVANVAAHATQGDLVYERQSRVGALFALSLCPLPQTKEQSNASPFVVAFGGAKGSLGVVDLAVESDLVRKRFADRCPPAALKVIQTRATRGTRQLNARRPKKKEIDDDTPDEDEDDDADPSGEESD